MKQLLIIMSILFSSQVFSQEVKIHTSAECGECKERLEKKLNYTKGIKFAEVDLATQDVVIGYNPKKISVDEIKKIISEIGYDADEVKAKPEAVQELPLCCRPGGMKH